MRLRDQAARIPADGLAGEALREAVSEFNAVTEAVASALKVYYGLGERDYIWPRMMYADRVVVHREGKLIQHTYSIGDDNVVRLGAPVQVTLEPTPVIKSESAAAATEQMTEAVRDGWFVEAKADGDKPRRYLVRVIRSGVSLNGVDYPVFVLREAAPLFEGARVFVKSDVEHTRGGGKDVRQLVGKLSGAKFVEAADKKSGEIRAVLDVLESVPVAAQLREAVERGMTDLFGLSIDATGRSKAKGKFREAVRIDKVSSVDLIIEPGAGGQILRFTEAAHQEPDTMLRQQMLDTIRRRDAARADALANADDATLITAYREAVAAEAAESDAGNRAAAAPAGISREELAAHTRLVEARAEARIAVGAARLPQAAKDRLNQRFAEAATAEDLAPDRVRAAIDGELAYGNTFRESAPVTGLGEFARPSGSDESVAQATGRMLDDFFSGRNTNLSFREAYIQITGDRNITGLINNCDRQRLAEAAGTFREAVSAATFADILGDSITRQMQREYSENSDYADWRDLVDVVPIRDFRTNERTQFGGYGNLPAVAENGSYAALTTPGDDKATYAISKRGGTETISIEAIANDDVGLIRRIPTSLARAAGRTLYEFIYAFLDTNALIYDGLALFVAGHNNIGTAALSATSFAAARLRMRKQTELSSGKRLALTARHLYIPSDLQETAFDLFVRGTNNDETFVQSIKPVVHTVAHWTDANNWYLTADKRDIPLIELGFFNGQETPELFVQDNPTQGSLFSNDQIKWKIRHIYGATVMDFRGFDGSIVA